MSYPLRLPAELDVQAREQCKRLGISLNALIAVALDQYLRGTAVAPGVAAPKAVRRVAAKRGGRDEQIPDGQPDWRFFHNADYWPWVDPDPAWEVERQRLTAGLDESAPAVMEQVERVYWATRERPAAA